MNRPSHKIALERNQTGAAMRYDPNAWERAIVNTEDLLVDLQNPRFAFRRLYGVESIVQYLVAREGVLDLAKKIADYGALFDNERIDAPANQIQAPFSRKIWLLDATNGIRLKAVV